MTSAEMYAQMRVVGQVTVPKAEVGKIGNLRRLAHADGLRVTSYDTARGYSRGALSPHQRRTAPYVVALVHPDNPSTIVRPDAQEARDGA